MNWVFGTNILISIKIQLIEYCKLIWINNALKQKENKKLLNPYKIAFCVLCQLNLTNI